MTDIAPLEPFVSFRFAGFNVDLPEHGDPIFAQLDVLNQRLTKFDWECNRKDGNILSLYVLDGADDQQWLDCLQALPYLTEVSFQRLDASGTPKRNLTFKNMEHLTIIESVEVMGVSDLPISARLFEFEFSGVFESL